MGPNVTNFTGTYPSLIFLMLLALALVTAKLTSKSQNQGDKDDEELSFFTKKGRQAFQIQKPALPAITINQKILRYNDETGLLRNSLSEIKLLSPIRQDRVWPLEDVGPHGEDLGIRWNVSELIRHASSDFRTEIHKVPTSDGYILTLFRITNAACRTRVSPPTFFQHGLLGSAADWLLLDPEYNLPFILATSGFDVWLGNARGNEYSQEHKFLTIKEPKYWNFSFHEMGVYDLPAVYDYIQNTTGKKQLNYVGYELGTTMFYVLHAQNPDEFNDRTRVMVGLGPTAYMSRSQSPVQYLKYFGLFYSRLKDGPLVPSMVSSFLRFVQPKMCEVRKHGQSLCSKTLALLFGAEENRHIGDKVLPRIFGHKPQTTSIKTFVHFLQLLQSEQFRQFDYGPIKNLLQYTQTTPPKYNLFLIHTKTLNFYGEQDLLLDRRDVEQTVSELGTDAIKLNIELMEFDHTSFLYSEYFGLANGPNIYFYLMCRNAEVNLGPCDLTKIAEHSETTCKCQGRCQVEDSVKGVRSSSNLTLISSIMSQENSFFHEYLTNDHNSE